jgi:mannose-1-phosphate guanylyltransferase / mannose-6-phosphate isomerase
VKVIVLAGGGGTRLFPLSRKSFPKQFLKVNGEKSLLVLTLERFTGIVQPSDMIVVTNQEYYHHVMSELKSAHLGGVHIVSEPAARNTAPAIALAVQYCKDVLNSKDDEVVVVTPADHLIQPVQRFQEYILEAEKAAKRGDIVTFGIRPDKPETGFGYIEAGTSLAIGQAVNSFKEKPDLPTAQRYVDSGNYYWNSGMFAFSLGTICSEFQKHSPDIYALTEHGYNQLLERFETLPNISMDYAIAEKTDRIMVIPMQLRWNDIGSWDAMYDVLPKDEAGNIVSGDCTLIDCSNSLFMGKDRLIAGIGLEDLIVVETNDVIVVAQKGETQRIKELVDILKAQKRREAEEHTTMYRPWGSYTVLGEGPSYKMKKIVVESGQRLSLQMHYHRSEHWIVINGTAKVTIGDQEQMVHENESVFIPKSTKHRLENPGKLTLEIIEIQNGAYLEEDDIVRFDDIYGRIN